MPTDHWAALNRAVPMWCQWIPAGAFVMGSRSKDSNEEPRHLVRITRPFYLGRVPVTQEQFAVWTREAGIKHANHFPGRSDHPAENSDHPAESMSWDEAMKFCAWLTTANRLGLSDMHGNVWEWCRDAYDADAYRKRVDGVADHEVGPADVGKENPDRVIRSGSWGAAAGLCRSASRLRWRPACRFGNQGSVSVWFPVR